MVPSALGVAYAQAVTADADDAVVEKPANPHSKYILTQVVKHNPSASYNPGVEKRILKHIDYFDSEISSIEEEIGKLLNL